MKKYIFILTLLCLPVALFSQNIDKSEYRKQYREGEMVYIKNQHIMTDAEFTEFQKIYNEYRDARKKIRDANKQIKAEEGKELTNEQAAANVQAKINKKIQLANAYKEYIAKLQTKLTNVQICKIEEAKKKYKKIKFRELRDDSVKAAGAFQSSK